VLLGYLAGWVAATTVLLLIPAGRAVLDSLWAEDGKIFLSQALTDHWYSPVFRPHEGYMHLVPRLFGMGARIFPVRDSAVLFTVGSALLRALVALFVFRASAGHLRSPLLRAFLAVFVILVPSGETFDNIANLHWYLLYAAVWAALWRPATRWENAVAAVAVGAAVCSDPLALIIAPIVLARCIALRRRRDHLLTATFVIATVIQLAVVAGASRSQARPVGWLEILRGYDARVLVALVSGRRGANELVNGSARIVVLLLAIVVFLAISAPLLRSDRPTWLIVLYLYGASLLLFALGWRHSLGAVPYPSRNLGGNSRYTVVPMLLVVTAVVLGLTSIRPLKWRWVALGGSAAVLLAAAVVGITSASTAEIGPTWHHGVTLARQTCRAHPVPMVAIHVDPGPPWVARIPCSRLGGR